MGRHENPGSTGGALSSQPLNLATVVHLVVLEDRQLDLLSFVLNLFRCCVILLFSFLATTSQTQDKMECGLLLDVIVRESSSILELLPGKNETLLIRGNP